MANPEHLAVLKQGVEVWNRWRLENPDIRPDLSEINDLGEINLSDANLSLVYFSKANLNGINFKRANLSLANLSRTQLNRANLSLADLRGAHLNLANLIGADLRQADFSRAILTQADLTQSVFNFTVFSFNDFSTVIGLESIRHEGPSSIDTHTLFASKNLHFHKNFLQECGVPKMLIEQLPRLTRDLGYFQTCFISYSHKDKIFSDPVRNVLWEKGVDCWYDDRDMEGGDEVLRTLEENVRSRDKLIVCCSKNSLESKYVKYEVNITLEKERELLLDRGKRIDLIIPLDLDGDVWEQTGDIDLKLLLRKRIIIGFKGWEKDNAIFEREIERVIEALGTD